MIFQAFKSKENGRALNMGIYVVYQTICINMKLTFHDFFQYCKFTFTNYYKFVKSDMICTELSSPVPYIMTRVVAELYIVMMLLW